MQEEERKRLTERLERLRRELSYNQIEEYGDSKADDEAMAIASKSYDSLERERVEIDKLKQEIDDLKQNRKQRKDYAKGVFRYLVCYSLFVAALLISSGFKIKGFDLPDVVLATLVGSTAAAAIGLVYAVVNGLFGNMNKKD